MKRIIIALLLIVSSTSVFSQVKARPGIRAGVNYSKLTNTTLDAKAGLYAGVFLNIQFTNFYALQPEVSYSNQGGKSNISGVEDLSIDYVSVAVMNKFFVMNDQKLHLMLGPTFETNFEDNFVRLANGSTIGEVTPVDIGFVLGVGYQFKSGLVIEARYKQGLIDVDYEDNHIENKNQLNSVFQVGAAYKFDF